ncbi:unnamed protein product [Rangifer tarandus platyrhynchus]|uniref:Uncharacterized protein n=2 Tax=Rangifer tarandus platyrhynchus TaxID=3082113 RepID=A0ABN8ZCD7_RANTA|nr:unnamed protein product [Rangifer tarandus platyrhynchus]CAI9705994.1 unnamed protein product [Rangifer tarandus platyrhynchus]
MFEENDQQPDVPISLCDSFPTPKKPRCKQRTEGPSEPPAQRRPSHQHCGHRLRYRLHHCVRLPYSASYGQGAETPKVLRIQNLSVGRGLLSTLPYCVPLMLLCAAAAWELCTPGPVLDLQ